MARILIVEDEHAVRNLFVLALRRAEHEVIEAGNCAEAERLWQPGHFDCVICDNVMPGKHGLVFLKELVAAGQKAPILISGYLVNGDLEGIPLLQKPFMRQDLVVLVSKELEKARTAPPTKE